MGTGDKWWKAPPVGTFVKRGITMPKMKTNKSAAKRFRIGGTGRIKHKRSGISHNTGKKSGKFLRQHRGTVVVNPVNEKAVQRLLPNG